MPTPPTDIFQQLLHAASADCTIEERFAMLRQAFYQAVDSATADCAITFSGLFAKVDYLIKEHNVPSPVAQLVHATRKVLFPQGNSASSLTSDELNASFPHDLKATAMLVSYIHGRYAIPQQLKSLFPVIDRKSTWGRYSSHKLRIKVTSIDDAIITGVESYTLQEVRISYGPDNTYLTRNGKGDWSYLRNIISPDDTINIVRVREKDDLLLPELIIYSPDYLVNITTVAACFDEAYRETPYLSLLSKLRPDEQTVPIMLGNLAGQLLDDALHHSSASFDESFDTFMKRNAIKVATCSDLASPAAIEAFRTNAAQQYDNIQRLVGHDLPAAVEGFDTSRAILEPTFFSETLGLQGRLDLLYEDASQTIIIEQKAGKGAYVRGTSKDAPPVAQTKHWVQLLLYRALFIYEFQKYSEQLRHIFLLYSKYPNGLISTAQSPELLVRAIRMRNLIAWLEQRTTQGEYSRLATIMPSAFRSTTVSDSFWHTYKLPELNRILGPMHSASPLEQAYFLRMLRFIATEQMLAKVGNGTRQNPGFAAKWTDTLADKHASGDIYDDLTIDSIHSEQDCVQSITLRFSTTLDADTSNFRLGDIVILYAYRQGDIPNACAQMVHRASIADITSSGITLRLRNGQTDANIFSVPSDMRWAIEHDLFDASSASLCQGMHRFLTASAQRRDMLMLQRTLNVDSAISLTGSYGAFDPLVLGARQSRDVFIVIGPPGTGKTSFGMLNILQEELLQPSASVLLLSYTNRAVDEICSKLVSPDMPQPIDFIRIGSELSCASEYRDHLLDHRAAQCATIDDVHRMIQSTRVFCGTTSALNGNIGLLAIKHFSLAIIDEASQILEPHLIGLLSAQCEGRESIGRIVMIGDHKQLPAVVQQSAEESRVTEAELLSIGLTDCRLSMFERFLRHFRTSDGSYDPRFVFMLTRQGRMHRDVARFANEAFYAGRLGIVGAPALPHQEQHVPQHSDSGHGIIDMLTTKPVAFVATPYPHPFISEKVNQVEADMIAATVLQIYHMHAATFSTEHTVGVIVPYRNQISTIRTAIDRYGIPELHGITIDTVERYQGSQRDYIIYGFTIQRPYQLEFLTSNCFIEDECIIDRKLNVAMTRARLRMVLFGNPHLLQTDPVFSSLMQYARSCHSYISTSPADYCSGSFKI